MEVAVLFRGSRIRVGMEPGSFTVEADRPVEIEFAGTGSPVTVGADGVRVRRLLGRWEVGPG
jgi:hypothetical protein